MQSANRVLIFSFLVIVSWSCGPANVSITANPKRVGYKRNDVVLVAPLTGVSELENEQLMLWATEYFKNKLPIQTTNYWDALYKSKQHGLALPSYNHYDTASFTMLKEKLGVNFILLSTLNGLQENDENEFNNPNYKRRIAIVSFQLIDLEAKIVVWHCTTRVCVGPFKAKDGEREYTINVLGGNFATNKAYKKSLSRLFKSWVLVR